MNKPLRLAALLCLLIPACTSSPSDDPGDCADPQMVYPDSDGDGYGDTNAGIEKCDMPDGYVARAGDCADDNADVHPESKEVCDTIDNNCDGKIDDADPMLDVTTANVFYKDADGDTYGTSGSMKKACVKPTGYTTSKTDCDDTSPFIHPGAAEVCDHVDNDCNGLTDVADPAITNAVAYYRDADNDHVGAGVATMACDAPSGYALTNNDCNDTDSATYPGAIELCDGGDNDCDGGIDGTPAQPNRCTSLVGTYTGSYTHLTQEKVGSTVVNSMQCSGTGSASLVLSRKPGIQGTFTCNYPGSLGGFDHNQSVTLNATVALDGTVKGTVDHQYSSFGSQHRVYNVTGTQTATGLNLTGTDTWLPNPMSAVPWVVSFSFTTSR